VNRVLFIFVDGLGLGDPGAASNPVRHRDLDLLANFRPADWTPPRDGGRPESLPEVVRDRPLPRGGRVVATDASLGVPGLPQSATGQTTIFTGENAAAILGRHFNGVPLATLQKVLLRSSIMKRLVAAGRRAVFVNAFRPLFFELGDAVWKKGMSATTWTNHAAGLPFKTVDDLLAGRAVYQDITHDSLRARGYDIAERTPERAGEILAALTREHDFTLFEFFQTDKAGHGRDEAKAVRELLKLERMLGAVLAGIDPVETTVILTSDHGNIEDLSTKTHSLNPVPTLVFGAGAEALAPRLRRLEDFTPVLLEGFGVPAG
jgi:2,3-bisphosphoglycerate-independent phosphoglycerate mutase